VELLNEESKEMRVKEEGIKTILLKRELGEIYRQVAKYDKATEALLSCLDKWNEIATIEENWGLKIDILSNLGCTNKEQGNYDDAKKYLGEVLDISREKVRLSEERRVGGAKRRLYIT